MVHVSRFQQFPKPLPISAPYRLRKRHPRPALPPYLVAADSEFLTDAAGRRPIQAYVGSQNRTAFTLTQREADLIALSNPGTLPPQALEVLHPWLPAQKYLADSDSSYLRIQLLVRRYGKHFFAAARYCDERWNTVCNVLRMASPLDARFHSAWHLPLQDVFVLEENRPDRGVIAIDFNALYGACMQQEFPAPNGLRQIEFHREARPGEALAVGLYRCSLGGEVSDFIRRFNPFRSFFSGRYLGTSLDEEILVDLNEFEVSFYQQHFSRVHLIDAVVSDRVVAHPLAKEVCRAFAQRQNYKAQGNKPLADREKHKMTLMSSCSGRPQREICEFSDLTGALDHLRSCYGVQPHVGEPSAAVASWLGNARKVALFDRLGRIATVGPALNDGSACHSLVQRIVAWGRTRLLREMERIVGLCSTIEICYCNIDSIHFSVPLDAFEEVYAQVREQAGTEMGRYKIEAVARHGLWLEPGRYWLYGQAVEKFKNRGIGDGVQPFRERKVYVASRMIEGLHIPVRAALDLSGSMSDAKSMELDARSGLVVQRFVEIADTMGYADTLARLDANRKHSVPRKLEAFQQLRDRMKESSLGDYPAALPRCGVNGP